MSLSPHNTLIGKYTALLSEPGLSTLASMVGSHPKTRVREAQGERDGGGVVAGEGNIEQASSAAMADLARVLQRSHRSVDDTLRGITDGAREIVSAVDDASITLVVGRRTVESRAATSALPVEIDRLQHSLGEGPCLDAVWERRTYVAQDLSKENRWPRFSPAAVQLGVLSMLSFQLFTDASNLGALNLLSRHTAAFDDDDMESARLVAAHGAVALVGAQTEDHLQSALATRDIIGQAKGIIMERYDLTAVAAFEMIRTLSQQWQVPVAELAVDIAKRTG